MSEELCQRCGELGSDRRTLYHSCFYAMEELKVPFLEVKIAGKISEKIGTQVTTSFFNFPIYETNGTDFTSRFYTLRVCKQCRADWLASIKQWFTEAPSRDEGNGSGIYIRRNGVNVEVTTEEFYNNKRGASK